MNLYKITAYHVCSQETLYAKVVADSEDTAFDIFKEWLNQNGISSNYPEVKLPDSNDAATNKYKFHRKMWFIKLIGKI